MKTSRLVPFGVGCIALATCLLVAGAIVFLITRVPTVAQQLPPNAVPIFVTLTTPLNGTTVPLNNFTTVAADALGARPIIALELWVDDMPVQTENAPSADLKQFSTFWPWTPASQGEHTLLVRATDADHRIGVSNVVRVTASQEANTVLAVTYQAKLSDTVQTVAQKFKTTPQQIIDLNPQVVPSNPMTPGQAISVPLPFIPPPPTTPAPDTPAPAPTPEPAYVEQPSCTADRKGEPGGGTCLVFPDNYFWLVNDSVVAWESGETYQGKPVQIARGAKADYYHVLGTLLVKKVPKKP